MRIPFASGATNARWSVRFPIYDRNSTIALIGVVSPDFQQNATRQTPSSP